MSVTTTLDADRYLYLVVIEDETSVAEVLTAYEALIGDPGFSPDMHAVWDLSRLDLKQWPVQEFRNLVRELKSFTRQRGTRYKAALVTSRPVDFQLLRIYLSILKLLGSDIRLRLFRQREEAYDWIAPK